jgi:Na+-transporting methylmalonyl-CoA/oxaloacetate decarboxylase gamma subunit
MIFGLVMALITRGINLSAGGMGLIFFSSLVILVIDWLLTRQLSRVLDMHRFADAVQPAKNLKEKAIPQIGSPGEPISTVTEHLLGPLSQSRASERHSAK